MPDTLPAVTDPSGCAPATPLRPSRASRLALFIERAQGFLDRARGLMGRPAMHPRAALLITRCTAVHTCFMRFPIDLVYLDADWRVVRCVHALKPWRFSMARTRRARHVLELPAGALRRLGLRVGDGMRTCVGAGLRLNMSAVPRLGLDAADKGGLR